MLAVIARADERIFASPRRDVRLLALTCAVLAVAVLVDRWAWALLAEWGGDVGILLGIAREGPAAVGMLNSHNDPNPNGLVIVASAILAMGDLRVASFLLSMLQALAVCWLAWTLTRTRGDALLVAQALLWCASLRAVSTELWAQWLMITLSTLSVAGLLHHLRKPRPVLLAVSFASACTSAAIYLPGVVPLIVISILWLARLRRLSREERGLHFMRAVVPVSIVFASAVALPFLRAVNPAALSPGTARILAKRLVLTLIEPVLALPALLDHLRGSFPRSLRPFPSGLVGVDAAILATALVVALLAMFVPRKRPVDLGPTSLRYALAFLLGIFAASPMVTGIALTRDHRMDQAFQVVPLLLAFSFGGILLRARGRSGARAATVARLLVLVFALGQAWFGVSVRDAILAGGTMTSTPNLGEVRAVVDRLGRELPPDSSAGIAIRYSGGADWFSAFLELHRRWHTASFTVGEVLDHEFAFRIGARNLCAPDCPSRQPFYLVDWSEPAQSLSGALLWTSPNRRIRIARVSPSRAALESVVPTQPRSTFRPIAPPAPPLRETSNREPPSSARIAVKPESTCVASHRTESSGIPNDSGVRVQDDRAAT